MKALSHQAERAQKLLVTQQPENHRIISMFELRLWYLVSLYGLSHPQGVCGQLMWKEMMSGERAGVYEAKKPGGGRGYFKMSCD